MGIFIKNDRYNGFAILLHWVMAILILFMLWYGHYVHDLPRGSVERAAGFQMHFSIGMTVLVLAIIRLFWRFIKPAPPLVSSMKPHEKALAKFAHYLFYVLMIGLPVAGWIAVSTSSSGTQIMFFDLFQWPWFPGVRGGEGQKALHELFEKIHVGMTWGMLGLFALHFVAVLYHSVLVKDGTMKRMVPWK